MTIPKHIQSSYLFAHIPFVKSTIREYDYVKDLSILKINASISYFYCELTPISNISDEDARELFEIEGYEDITSVKYSEYEGEDFGFSIQYNNTYLSDYVSIDSLTIKQVDFLRRKGYAVEFSGYTVEEWKESGRLKLKG